MTLLNNSHYEIRMMNSLPATVNERSPLVQTPNKYKGAPTRWLVVFCCIGLSVALERFAYYSISTSLPSFSSQFFSNPSDTILLKDLFDGTIYFLPVFGAAFADAYIGQYAAIVAGSVIYLGGAVLQLIAVYACDACSESAKVGLFFTAMGLIAFGCSLFKPSITIYCAYQATYFFGRDSVKKAFVWFYWMVSVGAITSGFVASKSQTKDHVAVGVATAVFASLLFFLLGSRIYKPWPRMESKAVLLGMFKVAYLKMTCKNASNRRLGRVVDFGNKCDERAKQAFTRLLRISLVFGVLIIFWNGYAQIITSFHTQMVKTTCVATNTTSNSTLDVCLADVYLNTINSGSLLLFLPLAQLLVSGLLEKRFDEKISTFTQMGLGFVFMTLAMISGGSMELIPAQDISSGWFYLPQVALLSLGESFAGVAGYYFAFTQSPKGLEGFVIGLHFCIWAISNYVAIAAVPSEESGHLVYYLFGVGGLLTVGLVFLVFVARNYQWAPPKDLHEEPQSDVEESLCEST